MNDVTASNNNITINFASAEDCAWAYACINELMHAGVNLYFPPAKTGILTAAIAKAKSFESSMSPDEARKVRVGF